MSGVSECRQNVCSFQGPPGRDGGSGIKGDTGLPGLPVSLLSTYVFTNITLKCKTAF